MRPLHVIAVMDGRAGHEKQTRGIIGALARLTPLGVEFRTLPSLSLAADIKHALSCLKTIIGGGHHRGTTEHADLIIGTGSHTHLPLLFLKKKTGARAVTCMTPAFPLKQQIDLCCIPRHDRPESAANIVITTGPPSTARPANAHDPHRGLILVGGVDEKSHTWDSDATLGQVKQIVHRHPDLRWTIATSPRTPGETIDRLQALAQTQHGLTVFRYPDTAAGWIETQYARNLTAWATADSISMIYEALTAGCQVSILPVRWKQAHNKFQRSIDDLVRRQWVNTYASWLAGTPHPAPNAALDDAARCAREILRRWWPERLPTPNRA